MMSQNELGRKVARRQLGRNGPLVPAMGFGLMMVSSHGYGAKPDNESIYALLDRAVELGATFWDSSDLYTGNEEALAQWFKRTGKRDQIFLASKFGYVSGSKTLEIDSSAEYCKMACNRTLQALGIDCIDLYYAHNVDTVTPIEETMRALVELQREGKIKHIGLSMVSSTALRRAVKIAPVAAYQPAYSLFTRDIEGADGTNTLATCRELGIAVGSATSAPEEGDMRAKMMPQFQSGAAEKNRDIVRKLEGIAAHKGCTVAQLALAWLLKQGDDVIPIPGTKHAKYLESNMAALQLDLSDEEEAEMRGIVDATPVVGGVVPDAFKSFLYRDTPEA
ncbi:hypothetical protein NLG97_g2385 [Lecanicillium saksenae]|uniref:Uncharacterized protein n=1 Tax=Lecanicillium saksenae TaxID=468837 RepID=A0ACC1R156_9HYPO|nr:hypothetical protein NLG97_g2385 [Lecanicillium saksenae]